jgi:TPR repeat protein
MGRVWRLSTAGLICLVAATFAISNACGQSVLDDVDECDSLAAHASDPERLADGVADDAIVPKLAIAACEAAVKRLPEQPRFTFQLGRAYGAANRQKDAFMQYQKAGEQGYGAALAYLGDAYQFGHGAEVNAEKALDAYRKAAAKGFVPAQGQIEMLTFDPAMYVLPAMGLLNAGDLANLRAPDAPLQAYLFGIALALGNECGSVLTPKAVFSLYNRRYPPTWTPEADAPVNVSIMGSIAEYDAKLFLRRHGCEGPVAARVKDNLNRLYLNP